MLDRMVMVTGRWATRLSNPATIVIGAATAFGIGTIAGLMVVLLPDPAIVEALQTYEPSVVTYIYDGDGVPYDDWSLERRQLAAYADYPEHLRLAVIASEDARFFKHIGIDPVGVARSAVKDLLAWDLAQGASTLTMQLPRNLDRQLGGDTWLPKDKRWERKVKEAIFAIQIERHYSKERIFEIYANQIYMGVNRSRSTPKPIHGIQAAAEYYLGKPVGAVTLAEGAMLAGIIQRPNRFDPFANPQATWTRRNFVLDRMYEEGHITADEAHLAKAGPLTLETNHTRFTLAPYFTEEIRKELIQTYGVDGIYRSGLEVFTTLDRHIQEEAERALDTGLRELDKRRGWRGVVRNLRNEGINEAAYTDLRWAIPFDAGQVVPGIIQVVKEDGARVRIGSTSAELTPEDIAWTGENNFINLVEPGDLIEVFIEAIDETGQLDIALDQEPEVEGAVLVLENNAGAVKAMVGGRRFDTSEFNRAVQMTRQTGSVFKPFVYTAAMVEGLTASHLVLDEKHTFRDPTTRQSYSPSNFENEYIGITSIAEAMSKSRNVATVKIQQQIGAENVVSTARQFGLTAPLRPYLSLGLGVIDVSLWEITRAYSVFPNQGVLVEPHLVREVRDRQGRRLKKNEPQAVQVIDSDIAYMMSHMLRGVIRRGSGIRALQLSRDLGIPLGGKTGTTDDYSDAWFVGFSPYHTIGVWVGLDEKYSLGINETGSRAALPIWIKVMQAATEDRPSTKFQQPANVVLRRIDPRTGLLHSDACGESLEMAFLAGTEPTERDVCTSAEHRVLTLPIYQQAYFIRDGRLDPAIYETRPRRD